MPEARRQIIIAFEDAMDPDRPLDHAIELELVAVGISLAKARRDEREILALVVGDLDADLPVVGLCQRLERRRPRERLDDHEVDVAPEVARRSVEKIVGPKDAASRRGRR
jgi:hypothetical protein